MTLQAGVGWFSDHPLLDGQSRKRTTHLDESTQQIFSLRSVECDPAANLQRLSCPRLVLQHCHR